jgi:hypothetical protein
MKTLLVTFFDIKCTVHFELIPQRQTVNQAYYVETLKRLHEGVCRNRPDLCPNDWVLHHAQGAIRQAVFDSKIDSHNGTPTPVPLMWFRMTVGCIQR